MDERSHEPEQPPFPPPGWINAPTVAPRNRRRRTNRIILIVTGSIFGFFFVVGAIGAALGKGKPSATPAAARHRARPS